MSGVIGAVAAASGPWIRKPAEFGKFGTSGVFVGASIKTGATAAALLSAVGAVSTHVVKQGAVASLAGNDTFVTVCDITGAGILSGIVGAAKETVGAVTSTIEVTVDGMIYTHTASMTGNDPGARHIIGLLAPFTLVAGDGSGVNSGTDDFVYLNQTSASSQLAKTALVWPQTARARGMAALKFDVGLKVRIKLSAIGTDADARAVGVLYQLDA